MMTATEKIEELLKNAVEKDLAFVKDKVKSFKSIEDVVELSAHFYDIESVITFFNQLEYFLNGYENFISRIEGVYRYDWEDQYDEEEIGCEILFPIAGGGDDVYDWGHIFKACAKNTLEIIKKLGGTIIMSDERGSWTYG